MHVDADSLGSYLRRERELQHVSLQDVSAATKIQLRFLTDLENDAYDQLPPTPFVVGFLRAYAQCLALDPEEIVAIYHAHYGTPDNFEGQYMAANVRPSQPARRFGWKGLSLTLVMAVLVVASIWRFTRDRQAMTPMTAAVPEVVERVAKGPLSSPTQTLLPANAPLLQKPDASSESIDASSEPVMQAAPTQTPTMSLQDVGQKAAAPAIDTAVADEPGLHLSELESGRTAPEPSPSATPPFMPQPSPASSSSSLMLQVMALEDTWLRVEIDSEQRHTLLLVAGKNIEWEAAERFMLTVGNAHGTRLMLNGRDVPLPMTRNNVVRDFVLTRNMVN